MAIARWNGEIIAESEETEMVEGNHYFPLESVHAQYLRPSETVSVCPWKGTASYYTLHVNGQDNPDAAWFYPEPKPEAANLRNHVAFWRGVEVSAG